MGYTSKSLKDHSIVNVFWYLSTSNKPCCVHTRLIIFNIIIRERLLINNYESFLLSYYTSSPRLPVRFPIDKLGPSWSIMIYYGVIQCIIISSPKEIDLKQNTISSSTCCYLKAIILELKTCDFICLFINIYFCSKNYSNFYNIALRISHWAI